MSERVPWTDEQRTGFLALVREDPYRGHVVAARKVGVPGTRLEIKQALAADDELQLAIEEVRRETISKYGLGVPALLERLGELAHNPESRDQFKATVFGLGLNNVIVADRQQVEHTGPSGGAMEVTVEHDYDRLIDKLSDVGLIQRGHLAAPDAKDERLLPAPPD